MQLAAFASAASSFVASTPQPKHQRRRREHRINDAFQRTIGHLLVISHTDQRARASQASSTTSSIIRTLCLTQSLLTLLLQLSSVPMATAAPLLYCHRLDAFPRRLYATKTSYDDVRSLHDNGDISRVVWARNQTESDAISTLSGCVGCDLRLEQPLHLNGTRLNGRMRCRDSSKQKTDEEDGCEPGSVYLLARHGTRFNKLTNMNRMTEQLRRIQDLIKAHAAQGAMCREDLDWLGEWKPRHTANDDSKLSNSGWNELQNIGRRYGELFSEVLRHAYTPSLYEFRYTNYTGKGDRTRQSAKAFATGLWGDFNWIHLFKMPQVYAERGQLNFYKRVTQHKPPFRNAFSVRYPERKGRFKVKEAGRISWSSVKDGEIYSVERDQCKQRIRIKPLWSCHGNEEVKLVRRSEKTRRGVGEFDNVQMIENARPDWLLQFYEHCHKYLQMVGAHPVEDYEKFKTGPEMTEVIDDVNKRLGLPKKTLGFPDVYLIFENCRLEHGLHRDAPWCSVLTPAMLEVIEYHQDIKYYWEDSYGHRISYEPACTLVKDILHHLQDETKMGRFRFAHSGTLDALYTRIGLFEDEQPLRANNFAHHRSRRRWATSRSTPMAANIVFVKYRCRHPPLIRVKTLVNENVNRPVTIPGCPPSALCPLDTLTALWRPIADNCDIERICDQPSTTTTTNNDAMKTASTPTDA